MVSFILPWTQENLWFSVISRGYKWEYWPQVRHMKRSIPLWISSINVTKSAGNCGFGHIYWRNPLWKTSLFVQWNALIQHPTFFTGLIPFKILEKLASDCKLLCANNPLLLWRYRRIDLTLSLYGLVFLIIWWPLNEGDDLRLSFNIFRRFSIIFLVFCTKLGIPYEPLGNTLYMKFMKCFFY